MLSHRFSNLTYSSKIHQCGAIINIYNRTQENLSHPHPRRPYVKFPNDGSLYDRVCADLIYTWQLRGY